MSGGPPPGDWTLVDGNNIDAIEASMKAQLATRRAELNAMLDKLAEQQREQIAKLRQRFASGYGEYSKD